MSKLRLSITGAALCVALLSIGAAVAALPPSAAAAAPLPAPPAGQAAHYLLREHEGELCVFAGQTLLHHTGIPVSTLPAADRERLRQGISAPDRQALYVLLEDLGS